MVDVYERSKVLLEKASTIYACNNYIDRMQGQLRERSAAAASDVHRQHHQHHQHQDNDQHKQDNHHHHNDHHHQQQPQPQQRHHRRHDDNDHSACGPNKRRKSHTEADQQRYNAVSSAAAAAAAATASHQHDQASAAGGTKAISKEGSIATSVGGINPLWREKICDWAYQVVDYFHMDREIVAITMSHVDRYLSMSQDPIDKHAFQLLSMTCLYLAIKLYEYRHIAVPGSNSTMEAILMFSKGVFTIEQVQTMEVEVLRSLQWFVHPPTAHTLVDHMMMTLDGTTKEFYDIIRYMIELSVLDYYFVPFSAGDIAFAAILNAREVFGMNPAHSSADIMRLQEIGLFANDPAILACRQRLSLLLQESPVPSSIQHMMNAKDSADPSGKSSPVSVLHTHRM